MMLSSSVARLSRAAGAAMAEVELFGVQAIEAGKAGGEETLEPQSQAPRMPHPAGGTGLRGARPPPPLLPPFLLALPPLPPGAP